ncbi:MAG: hypothetical protein HKL82_00200 [Acidimicrobiaceae bacterium]|nr:hypothetical protein [Acidimicrobiaceae bacterium]
MSGRFKISLLLAFLITAPSLMSFSNGMVDATTVLERFLLALVAAFVANGIVASVVAYYRIDNLRKSQELKRMETLNALEDRAP